MDGLFKTDGVVVMRFAIKEEVATSSTFGPRFFELGYITLDVKDHVGGMLANNGTRVSCTIIQ